MGADSAKKGTMNTKTIIALLFGTIVMMIPILILMKLYKVKLWKGIPISFILTVTGTVGTYIWYSIETIEGFDYIAFGGRSYYGAVFVVPLVFLLIAKLFKIPYGELMDFCAPAECAMLVIMKYQCLVDGCCGGRIIYEASDGAQIRFPSQIVEVCVAAVIFAVLMLLAFKKSNRRAIYPYYLIIYGSARFVLNFFRDGLYPFILGIPPGHFWSVCAVIAGVLVLYKMKNKVRVSDVIKEEFN